MKQLMLVALAATSIAAAPAMADTACTVTVTKFHQSYPYSGKATVEYTVGGTLPANAFAEITINTDDASATFVQSNIVTGANSHVIDFASSFGGVRVLTDASFVVAINLNPAEMISAASSSGRAGRTGRNATWALRSRRNSATTSGGATRWGIPEAEEYGRKAPVAFTT